jgi:hypothetical protein
VSRRRGGRNSDTKDQKMERKELSKEKKKKEKEKDE